MSQQGHPTTLALLLAFAVVLASSPLCAGDGIPQWKGASPNSADTFRFVVMGDNTGTPAPGQWEEAVRQVNLLKPDFVMSVGDFITGYGAEEETVAGMWDAFEEKLKKLEAPFYYCAGNHDISNPLMRKVWLARYGVDGKSYYSFDRNGCHFVVLDTASPLFEPSLMEEQIVWLRQDIAAAREARHIFLFTHIPQMQNSTVWKEFVRILPADRTTIFFGHIHDLSWGRPDGLSTYILGASGAEIRTHDGSPNRPLGKFRMFVHVTVSNGKPTVAVLPVGEVLPGEVVSMEFIDTFNACLWPQASTLSQAGGPLTHRYRNALSVPLRVRMSWTATDWAVRPQSSEATIPSGEEAELRFVLTPRAFPPDFPTYTVVFETTDPSGTPVVFPVHRRAWFPAEMEIARITRIAVDGAASDWRRVKPYELKSRCRVHSGEAAWNGEHDSSARIYLGHDGQRLYVCLDVADDQIAVDETRWDGTDAVQFFWDSRPKERRGGTHGVGTGHLVLPVPGEGKDAIPVWVMGERPVPSGLVAAIRPTTHGYVCEFSLPLAELGISSPVRGQEILLEFKVDDCDIVDGARAFSSMNTSGRRGSDQATGHYARCRFR